MEPSWNTAIQALIIALSTWYVRRGSKKDTAAVKSNSEFQISNVADQILQRLDKLEVDMRLVKASFLKEPDPAGNQNETKGRVHGKSI